MTFKSDATPLCFLMICFTINIVHATPTIDINVKNEDNEECLRQIKFAFKSDKATDCFKYAIEHYKKGEYIPVYESEIPSTSAQSQNIASTSGQSQSVPYFYNQSFPGQTSDEQYNISLEDLSYIGNFDGLQDFMKNDSQNNPQFVHGQSSGLEDFYNQSFPGQTSDGQYNISLEDLSYIGNFDGLQDFIKNEQHQNPLNYAMAYYVELENMVQGTNVIPAIPYCNQIFYGDKDCLDVLKEFGDETIFAKYAVKVALTKYKITKDNNRFIRSYMLYLRDNIKIRNPSKSPKNFCQEIMAEFEWYLRLKSL